jgi:hypothetical protein
MGLISDYRLTFTSFSRRFAGGTCGSLRSPALWIIIVALMGAPLCWAVTEADTQFTIFDLSALKKKFQILISDLTRLSL